MVYHRKEERTFNVLHISPNLLFFSFPPPHFLFPIFKEKKRINLRGYNPDTSKEFFGHYAFEFTKW